MVLDYNQLIGQQQALTQARLVSEVEAEKKAQAEAIVSQQVASQSTTPTFTTVTISGYDREYQRLQDKLDKVQDKIDTYKDKLASGKSSEQDRIQYQRYIQVRETILSDIKDLERYKEQAISREGFPVSKVETPPTVNPTITTSQNNSVFVNGQGYSVAPSLQSEFIARKQSVISQPLNFNPETQTVPRTISPQETMSIPLSVSAPFFNVQQSQGTVQPTSEVFSNIKIQDTVSRVQEKTGDNPLILVPLGVGVGVIEGAYALTVGLPQTVKSVINIAKNPSEAGQSFGKQLQENPSFTLGEIYGQSVGGSKVIEYGSKLVPKVVETAIPSSDGSITVKSLAVERGGEKSFILGSTSPSDRFSLTAFIKAPDIKELLYKIPQDQEIRIAGATESKIFQKSLSEASKEGGVVDVARAEKYIPTAQSILKRTYNVESSFIEGFPKTTERLNEAGVKIALDVARESEGYVSGSFSRSAQLSKEYTIESTPYVLNKVPRDIDIHLVKQTPEEIQAIAEKTVAKFKSAGIDAQLKSEGGQVQNAILVKQPSGKYEKAIEFLGEGTLPKEEVVPDKVLGFVKEGQKINIEGTKATSLSEELRGVTQGVSRLRTTEGKLDIFPPEKRLKDIGSVSVSARTLQQSLIFGKRALEKNIETFESLFPSELVKEQVKLATESPDTTSVLLADYRMSKATPKPEYTSLISPVSNVPSSTSKNVLDTSFVSSPSNKSTSSSSSNISSNVSPSVSQTSPSPSPSISPSSSSSSYSPSSFSPHTSITPSPSTPSSPSNIFSPSNYPSPSTPSGSSYSPKSSFEPSSVIPPSVMVEGEREKKKNLFTTRVKSKGKFIPIGQSETIEEAFGVGRKRVERTLEASFDILNESGFRTGGLILPSNLRTSKANRNIFVQKEGNRLGSQTERSEIQFARKNKRKSIF